MCQSLLDEFQIFGLVSSSQTAMKGCHICAPLFPFVPLFYLVNLIYLVHPVIHSSIFPFHPSIHQFIHPSLHPSFHTSIHSYIHSSLHPALHSSNHPSTNGSAVSLLLPCFGPSRYRIKTHTSTQTDV